MEAELSFGVSVIPIVTHKGKVAVKVKSKNTSMQKPEKFEQIHKKLQKIIFHLRKNNPELCLKLQNILRFPYTCMRNQLTLESNQSKQSFSLKNILEFILPLH